MKSLFDAPLLAERPDAVRAMAHAVIAAVASWLLIALPIVLGGVFLGREGVGEGDYARAGTLVWLAGQGVAPHSPLGPMTMLPWLLTPLIVLVLRWSQKPLLRRTGQAAPASSAEEWAGGPAMMRLAIHAVVYGLVALGVSLLWGEVGGWQVSPLRAAWVTAVVASLSAASVLLTPQVVASTLSSLDVPRIIRDGCARSARVLAVLAGCGAVLVIVAGVRHAGEMHQAQASMAGSVPDHVALLVAQLMYLPTLMVWGVSWLVGTGFELGAGVMIQPGGGAMIEPFVPLVAALPRPGEVASWSWAALAIPMLVGAWAGWGVHRRWAHASLVRRCGVAVQIAALVGVMTGLACWAASGSLGTSALRRIGPDPVVTATALTCELVVPAVLVVVVGHVLDQAGITGVRLRRVEDPDGDASPAPSDRPGPPTRPATDPQPPATAAGHRRQASEHAGVTSTESEDPARTT